MNDFDPLQMLTTVGIVLSLINHPSFIYGTQIKIFLMNSEGSDPPIDSKDPNMINVQIHSKGDC